MDELVFTPASLLDLLSQIDELKDLNVGLTETIDGKIQLQVGDSVYIIGDSAESIQVDEQVIEDVSNLNEDTYNDLAVSGQFEDDQPIESGIIAELAKTLLIGGVARLTAKYLKN